MSLYTTHNRTLLNKYLNPKFSNDRSKKTSPEQMGVYKPIKNNFLGIKKFLLAEYLIDLNENSNFNNK